MVSNLTREWSKTHEVLISVFDSAPAAYEFGGSVVDLAAPASDPLIMKFVVLLVRSRRLRKLFLRERPDLIVSFMESANIPTIIAGLRVKVLGRVLISVRNNPAKIPILIRLLVPIVYLLPRRIVVPSRGLEAGLTKMGLPKKKLSVIANPVRSDGTVERSPHIVQATDYVLGAGRLVRQKGFDRLLKAFAMANPPGVELVILGEGAEKETLIEIALGLGIGSKVRFPGAVSEIDSWYRRALCFVLASHYEGSPNVVIEAMANGCPVVSFDCPYGPADILDRGRFGILVPADDVEGLSEGIREVVSDPLRQTQLRNAGLRRARSFSVERIAGCWLSL